MAELDALVEWGLSEAEAKVYVALLESGSTLAGTVIRKTGLHRATTYQLLHRLKEKGLVSSVIVGKKQFFEAVNPNRLLDVLKEKESRLQDIIPLLQSKLGEGKQKQEITMYYGTKGIRSVLDKMLEELQPKGMYYDFGVSGLFRNIMGAYWDLWQQRKRKLGIQSKVIFNEEIKERNPKLLADYVGEGRYHPKEFASMTDTMIYKDTVILLIWTAKPPIAVVIKNQDNANSYLNQFKLLWKNAKK